VGSEFDENDMYIYGRVYPFTAPLGRELAQG